MGPTERPVSVPPPASRTAMATGAGAAPPWSAVNMAEVPPRPIRGRGPVGVSPPHPASVSPRPPTITFQRAARTKRRLLGGPVSDLIELITGTRAGRLAGHLRSAERAALP